MGSSSSKDGVASSSSSSSSSAIVRRTRSKGASVFQSSCLGRSSGSYDSDNDNQVSDDQNKDHGSLSNETCTVQTETMSDQGKRESCGKLKVLQANEVSGISSDVELDEESVMASGSSTRAASSRSLNSSSRFCSRFSFIPSNISFRLSRAASLGSSRSYPLFSTSLTISNREEFHANTGSTSNFANRNETDPGRNLLQACSINRSPATQYEDTSALSGHLQDGGIVSTQDVTRNSDNTGIGADVNERSSRDPGERENIEARRPDRRIGAREPAERTVRFSRTLSVGRLRDRVLRRSSFSDGLFGRLQEDMEVRDSNESSRGQVLEGLTSTSTSDGNAEISPPSSSYPPSSMSSSRYANQDYEVGSTLQSRENGYHDITERRTDFLERRRRIRSQVRALQRLGNRFENLSGHERSCILSGQHRTGHCMCRTGNRTNPDDDTSARASISRIVMLAEALFEVLDEIHQQSVVLSSRTSVSSIGSVPAPKEVVESMPVKIYSKSHKHQIEEAAQCYICLVEYEEGDCMRILPCHHEFHQSCIDKWLKEIHRVCPLCRGDVCRSDSLPLPVEN